MAVACGLCTSVEGGDAIWIRPKSSRSIASAGWLSRPAPCRARARLRLRFDHPLHPGRQGRIELRAPNAWMLFRVTNLPPLLVQSALLNKWESEDVSRRPPSGSDVEKVRLPNPHFLRPAMERTRGGTASNGVAYILSSAAGWLLHAPLAGWAEMTQFGRTENDNKAT